MSSVMKTRKDHKCNRCHSIISKGSRAKTRSEFDGTTSYYHLEDCDYTGHRERMKKINDKI